MKIMVIDGNSIINRAYHGIRPLSNHEGTPTNAVYGFLSTLFKQQDEERPDRTVVCFDVKEKTFRHLKFDTYKATRKPMDEELAVQMPIVKEVLDALGIVERDRQIRIPSLRLRVNLDGETPATICEVKTHKGDKPFAVSKAYRQQCQVEMFASGHGLRRRKECQIIAYRLTDAEYGNYFLPIQMDRISRHPIPYDAEWIERAYLPRLKYLAACLKAGRWPREEEIPI